MDVRGRPLQLLSNEKGTADLNPTTFLNIAMENRSVFYHDTWSELFENQIRETVLEGFALGGIRKSLGRPFDAWFDEDLLPAFITETKRGVVFA